MSTSEAGPKTEILSVHDCWKYLRSASVGRLAVIKGAVPEIFPVNYLPEDGTVIFRTGPGTKLDAVLQGGTVALEADGLNDYGTIAWSVVLKGQPETAAVEGDRLQAADRDLAPWEEGVKDQLIRITPTELSGRRFVISSPQHWWQPRDAASSMD
ncbi:flavin-nucleotide-binding protein [Arthrobacter sp. Soil736]|uniref:pyridoxamine 5'-phosphate oxidase family protein n=1 Tax=Arthrobacter sp. Soil736 TaxID=1736395 RepID=UPI0006F94728|nr:pyridoxamine 5'-phosphate oxidase family protein [Arthrobacter sp. Soil736]KRE64975.1 flavin-nucleotide-binding protein [Arthrobacter sp. Soil736]